VWARQHVAAFRALVALTIVLGVAYPLAITLIAQLPGLQHRANGSLIRVQSAVVGSSLIGQAFVDDDGNPLPQYFQARASAAGAGYDPTASGASNLGPEEIIDTLPDSTAPGDAGRLGLLTLVCSRSLAVGQAEGVDGRRPYCTADGLGAVLSVIREYGLTGRVTNVVSVNQPCPAKPFISTYAGVPVQCAEVGVDYRGAGAIVPVRGPGKPWPANPVPPDAVTASGSGLDPDISVAYATLQAPRVAAARGLAVQDVLDVVREHTSSRTLGFMGERAVNVLQLNLALDRLRDA
jgi:K+-transporting ATPase ATPase C chain